MIGKQKRSQPRWCKVYGTLCTYMYNPVKYYTLNVIVSALWNRKHHLDTGTHLARTKTTLSTSFKPIFISIYKAIFGIWKTSTNIIINIKPILIRFLCSVESVSLATELNVFAVLYGADSFTFKLYYYFSHSPSLPLSLPISMSGSVPVLPLLKVTPLPYISPEPGERWNISPWLSHLEKQKSSSGEYVPLHMFKQDIEPSLTWLAEKPPERKRNAKVVMKLRSTVKWRNQWTTWITR